MADQIDPRLVAKYIMQYSAQENNLIKYQLDTEPELLQLRNDLLGLEYDEKQDQYIPSPYKEPLINEHGADIIITFLRLRISKITSLSDLDDQEINNRCHVFADDFTYLLTKHKSEFSVKSNQVVASIIGLADDIFFSTLKKARMAGERDSLRKQFTFVESKENVTQMQGANKTPFFANPLGKGG